MEDSIQVAVKYLRQTKHRVVALTGAGISAESGIPTFRGKEGYWRGRSPMQLASLEGFCENPQLVWEWYLDRRKKLEGCQPNAGHFALAALEKLLPGFALVTQNVDGLHHNAGSKQLVELHGNIRRTHCLGCAYLEDPGRQEKAGNFRCPHCGDYLRPSVVWFGESLPERAWDQAFSWAQEADVFLVIGTSAVVYPAASLIPLAKETGAKIIEINVEETAASDVADVSLLGTSSVMIPRLVMALEE
ncbi:MAG: SIR2 family NAD-dependent protein deacylase [Oligoflexus sp.]